MKLKSLPEVTTIKEVVVHLASGMSQLHLCSLYPLEVVISSHLPFLASF